MAIQSILVNKLLSMLESKDVLSHSVRKKMSIFFGSSPLTCRGSPVLIFTLRHDIFYNVMVNESGSVHPGMHLRLMARKILEPRVRNIN